MHFEQLTINCDMGESFGSWRMGADEKVMPWIDMANIACGFHASDPDIMSYTLQLAKKYQVKIGAHTSYQDLQGFGRRSIPHTSSEITHSVLYQIGALKALADLHKLKVEYIKPHGALYNDMMSSTTVFNAIAAAARVYSLPLMVLASSEKPRYLEMANQLGIELLFEAFADRSYDDNGRLAPRNHPRALLTDKEDIISQAMQIAQNRQITTLSGKQIEIGADTICIHGDNPYAIASVQNIKQSLAKG